MLKNKQKIVDLLSEQISQVNFRAAAYVFNEKTQKRPQRNIFIKMQAHLTRFLQGNPHNRWITLTGLRGAGKTTLLFQLFQTCQHKNVYRLFLSLDQTRQILDVSLAEVLAVYEELIGEKLENLTKPLVLFLDEVQYDQQWGLALKSVFDRSNRVFIFATGSAALLMNLNPDITRRAIFAKLFPLSFPEYLKIKQQKFEIKGLGQAVRTALLAAPNAQAVFQQLKILTKKADQYYLGVARLEFERYLNYGSLPFMLTAGNEGIIYDQINKTLERVVSNDIASTGRFGSEIVAKIPAILYSVADLDAFNFSTLAATFGLSRPKVVEILNLLEQTEVLHRLYPHGSHLNQARKPSKYLFAAPAFRSMYYKFIGNTISPANARGKLLEDLAGMYLYRILSQNPGQALTYDSAQGGADFIVNQGARKIVLEVGAGAKGYRQTNKTAKKVQALYSLIITNSELTYSAKFQTVKVPWQLFLLM